LKIVAFVLALIALGCGLVAAVYWYRSSKAKIVPAWPLEISGPIDKNIMGWVTGAMIAFRKSSDLNRVAAIWTGVSVTFGGLSAMIGSWPTPN